MSWRRKWQPTPVFLPGEFHGQRSLVGSSPWGRKESETTEQHSLTPVFLPGKSHGQRSLAGYNPWGYKELGHNLVTKQQQLSKRRNQP